MDAAEALFHQPRSRRVHWSSRVGEAKAVLSLLQYLERSNAHRWRSIEGDGAPNPGKEGTHMPSLCTTQSCPNKHCRAEVEVCIQEPGIPQAGSWYKYACPRCNVEAVFTLGAFYVVEETPKASVAAVKLAEKKQ